MVISLKLVFIEVFAKAGSGIGAAIPAWIMDLYGYIPSVYDILILE